MTPGNPKKKKVLIKTPGILKKNSRKISRAQKKFRKILRLKLGIGGTARP